MSTQYPSEEQGMLDWLGSEGARLQVAFRKVFGEQCRPFGNRSIQRGGLSDGNAGVQWNAGIDPRVGLRWVGVNLEGMEYDGWPVARLIKRELKEPSLPRLVPEMGDAGSIEVLWRRDYWQATSRPPILEREIAPTPIPLHQVSDSAWRKALAGALECLDADRGYRGRATQTVTLASSGREVTGPVSPHLTFIYPAAEGSPWEPFLREGKAKMETIYEWTVDRTAAAK